MVQWSIAFDVLEEDAGFIHRTYKMGSKLSPFLGDVNPSSDIHTFQAVMWCIDALSGKSSVHIKKKINLIKPKFIIHKISKMSHEDFNVYLDTFPIYDLLVKMLEQHFIISISGLHAFPFLQHLTYN